jgi:PLP dependent protein
MSDIERNLQQVQQRIGEAAARAGRDPSAVQLVAISKTFPPEAILRAYEAGARHFGENRVEDALPKIAAVSAALGASASPTWHMVGHVQGRKAGEVLQAFDVLHSLDSARLGERLDRLAVPGRRRLPVLLECNVSGEESKFGFDLAGWEHEPARLAAFVAVIYALADLPALELRGLMTMAPLAADPEDARPVFASLRALRDVLRERCPDCAWPELSMGMTDDFEVAIEEGATMVRVGRAVFGTR